MKRTIVAVLLVTLVMQVSASGQSPTARPQKSTETALALSLGITVASCVTGAVMARDGDLNYIERAITLSLVYPGLALGPGAGHLYADKTGRFAIGGIIRAIALPLVLAGLRADINQRTEDALGAMWTGQGEKGDDKSYLWAIPLVVYLYSTIRDIAGVDNSVRDYNNSPQPLGFELRPCFEPETQAIGLAVSFNIE